MRRRSGSLTWTVVLAVVGLPTLQACTGSSVTDGGGPGDGGGEGPSDASVVVRVSERLQTVDGFGATTESLIFPDGDHLGPHRAAAIDSAYGSVGLSLGFLNIGLLETPADATDLWAERGNDDPDPEVIRWEGFNSVGMDRIHGSVLAPARRHGYRDVTLGPLLNLKGPLSWMRDIRASDYDRYLAEAAEHVQAAVRRWTDAYGAPPDRLQLFNEPTTGNRELASSSVGEVVDLIAAVGGRLGEAGFGGVRLVVPNEETMARSLTVARAILSDPAARPWVGAIGYHPYPYGSAYASVRRILEASGAGAPDPDAVHDMEALKALGREFGVPVWMTEVSQGPGNADYPFGTIENVLARAIHIHDAFEYAGASAFFGMQAIWDSRTHAEHFAGRDVPFLTEQSAVVLADVGSGEVLTTGMGYAIGHYARFVEPGSVRLGTGADDPGVLPSAFLAAGGDRVVLVVVNAHARPVELAFRLEGAEARGEAAGEVSHSDVRRERIPGIAPSSGSFGYVMPARSVATLVIPVG